MDVVGTSQHSASTDPTAEELARVREQLQQTEEHLARLRKCVLTFAECEAKFTLLHLEYENMVHSYAWRFVLRLRFIRHIIMPRHSNRSRLMLKILSPITYVAKSGINLANWILGSKPKYASEYERWIAEREAPALANYPPICEVPNTPRLSFFLIDQGDSAAIDRTVESLRKQSDPAWELWIGSRSNSTGISDDRIHRERIPDSLSNSEWIQGHLTELKSGFSSRLKTGDQLHPRAVSIFRDAIAKQPDTALFSCDEDHLDNQERRTDPIFKPQWSAETLRSHDYLGALKLISIEAANRVGGLNPEFGKVAGYDLALRLAEAQGKFQHLPHVLIHTAPRKESKERAEQAIRAVQKHLDRQSIRGDVKQGLLPGTHQVRYATSRPLISIIIPSKDQPKLLERCVYSIEKSSYNNREILIVDNQSQQEATHESNAKLAARKGVRLIDYPHPFNFAAMNNYAVKHAKGEVLLFLNNDTEALNEDWLDRMVEHAMQPKVGAVGAKLIYPNDTIQHAGIILAMNDGTCGHYQRFFPKESHGYANRLMVVQNLTAVTAACVMMRRSVFDEVSGFDEMFASDFNDIDLCLRIREAGYQIIWTPYANLYHYEGLSRGKNISVARLTTYKVEQNLFLQRWTQLIAAGDPFYSPNLTLRQEDCTLRW